MKALDIHKQGARPQTWNTHPDNTVPKSRPIAFAI